MDSIKVSDCMSESFVTFSPDMGVVEAAIKLVEHDLLGGPVVDEHGCLVGWISEQDCIGVVAQVVYYEDRVALVKETMTPQVSSVATNASALDLAEDMKNHKRKMYPVVDQNNKVIGVISRRNILRKICDVISHPEHG